VPEGGSLLDALNPDSLEVVQGFVEPSIQGAAAGTHYQFERTGYFVMDSDSAADKLIFNRAVGLKDSYARLEKGQSA
jgi:glutaminyl-tRNA synthetase